MGKVVDRTGETNIANNGLRMQIIEYRRCDDIDIQFEDGIIIKNKDYINFSTGQIKHPTIKTKRKTTSRNKDRIGEKSVSNNGQIMTIIEYNNSRDITVEFEDSTVVKNISYGNFKAGRVNNANNSTKNELKLGRVGEVNTAKNGLKMTIIKYNNSNNIDVEFEDGTVVKNKMYSKFLAGNIGHPTIRSMSHIGEVKKAYNGMKMTIIEYRSYNDIDIKFEDGNIVTNKQYGAFKAGNIGHPTIKFIDHTGEKCVAANGLEMEIINYRNYTDIDVKFEDGIVVKNTRYDTFLKGYISHPKYTECIHVGTFNNEKLFICTCKKCKNKHVLKLSEMKDFKCTQ